MYYSLKKNLKKEKKRKTFREIRSLYSLVLFKPFFMAPHNELSSGSRTVAFPKTTAKQLQLQCFEKVLGKKEKQEKKKKPKERERMNEGTIGNMNC